MIYVGDDSLFGVLYDEKQIRGTVIQKKIDEYSENEQEKIGKIHKLIQIAQNEIMQYISKTDPSRIDEIKRESRFRGEIIWLILNMLMHIVK